MTITKQKKVEILGGLENDLKDAKIIIFVNFHGLSVSLAADLRKILRKVDTKYLVAKKTLIRKALENLKIPGEIPELEGEIAIAYSETDPLAPAKELKDFAKKNKIKLLGGVFENQFIGGETVVMLANIPSKQVLLGQFVNIINSPIQGIVGTLNDLTGKFVRVLNEVAKTK